MLNTLQFVYLNGKCANAPGTSKHQHSTVYQRITHVILFKQKQNLTTTAKKIKYSAIEKINCINNMTHIEDTESSQQGITEKWHAHTKAARAAQNHAKLINTNAEL